MLKNLKPESNKVYISNFLRNTTQKSNVYVNMNPHTEATPSQAKGNKRRPSSAGATGAGASVGMSGLINQLILLVTILRTQTHRCNHLMPAPRGGVCVQNLRVHH